VQNAEPQPQDRPDIWKGSNEPSKHVLVFGSTAPSRNGLSATSATSGSVAPVTPLRDAMSEPAEDICLDTLAQSVFDPQELCCEVAIIDPAIEASGLADEYELPTHTMRTLAVNANALISVAMCAPTEEEFLTMLNSFRAPQMVEEMGFLFGYAEYVRQQLLEALSTSGRAEEIRQLLRRRIELAHAKCRQVVLQS